VIATERLYPIRRPVAAASAGAAVAMLGAGLSPLRGGHTSGCEDGAPHSTLPISKGNYIEDFMGFFAGRPSRQRSIGATPNTAQFALTRSGRVLRTG
jgi:hypothetical protein